MKGHRKGQMKSRAGLRNNRRAQNRDKEGGKEIKRDGTEFHGGNQQLPCEKKNKDKRKAKLKAKFCMQSSHKHDSDDDGKWSADHAAKQR